MHCLWECWDVCLIHFCLPLPPILADGMSEMLATGQEAHKPGAWTAGVSFTNSLLQCRDPSFSLVLRWEILVLRTQNITNRRKCNSTQQTCIEHTLCVGQGRKIRLWPPRRLLSNGGDRLICH